MTDTTDSLPEEGGVPEDPEGAIEAGAEPEPGDFVDEGVAEADRLDVSGAARKP